MSFASENECLIVNINLLLTYTKAVHTYTLCYRLLRHLHAQIMLFKIFQNVFPVARRALCERILYFFILIRVCRIIYHYERIYIIDVVIKTK